MKSKLTAKQCTFIQEYLVDLNATQAAIRAGYSRRTAKEMGCENLSKPNIQEAIRVAMNERSERTGITADRVLEEIAKIGFSDIREVFTTDGKFHAIANLPNDIAAAVQSIEVQVRPKRSIENDEPSDVEHVYKVRLSDKLRGLELLGKHLGLFANRNPANQRSVVFNLNYGSPEGPEQIEHGVTIEGEPL